MNFKIVRDIINPRKDEKLRLNNKLINIPNDPKFSLIKRQIRQEINACSGHIYYYVMYKGYKLFIGDENTPKKQFKLYLNPMTFAPFIRKEREKLRNRNPAKYKEKVLSNGYRVGYKVEGDVLVMPGFFYKVCKDIKRKSIFQLKKPKTIDQYIGIELEYASKLDREQIADLILDHNLQDSVRVMTDRTIVSTKTHPYTVELCVLTKAKDLKEMLTKLQKVIDSNFMTNHSCGLHIHLDVRGLNPHLPYKNLVLMQNLLFSLVDETRKENTFCLPVYETDFEKANGNEHYAAISKSSYYKHNTIEVRMHHGTIDLTLIENWINLLSKIAYYNEELDANYVPENIGSLPGDIKSNFEQLKAKVKIEENLIKYIEGKLA